MAPSPADYWSERLSDDDSIDRQLVDFIGDSGVSRAAMLSQIQEVGTDTFFARRVNRNKKPPDEPTYDVDDANTW